MLVGDDPEIKSKEKNIWCFCFQHATRYNRESEKEEKKRRQYPGCTTTDGNETLIKYKGKKETQGKNDCVLDQNLFFASI